MATKTISLELDAYEKLKAAKTGARDSFSKVIRRTEFEKHSLSGADLLAHIDSIFASLPDDRISLDEALASLPDDPPVTLSAWDEVENEMGANR